LIKDLPTEDLNKEFLNEKYIDIFPINRFDKFPDLLEGLEYLTKEKNKITIKVNTDKISVKESLKKLLDVFEIEDMDVYYSDLESVIRNIYERDSTGH
jgi:ABC-type uncharacterized transport system ATPase subunit